MRSTPFSSRVSASGNSASQWSNSQNPSSSTGGEPGFDRGFDGFFEPWRLIAPERGRDEGALVERRHSGIDRIAVDDVEMRAMFGGAVDEPAGPEAFARSAGTDREDKLRPVALGGVRVVGEKGIRWHVASSFQVETQQETAPRREQEMRKLLFRRRLRRAPACALCAWRNWGEPRDGS